MRITNALLTILTAAIPTVLLGCGDDDTNQPVASLGLEVTPPSIGITVGHEGSATAIVTRPVSVTEPVKLEVSGAPAGITVTIVPSSLAGGSYTASVVVAVASDAPVGVHELTLTARAAGAEAASHPLSLNVVGIASGNFTIRPADPTILLREGAGPDTTSILIERVAPFAGDVRIFAIGVPAGLTVTITPERTSGASALLTVALAGQLNFDTYSFELRATADGQADVSYYMTVAVGPGSVGGLSLSLEPATVTLVAGGPPVSATVRITRTGTFTGAVDLDVWDTPAEGITATITPSLAIVGDTATLTLQASTSVTPGQGYYMSVLGTNTGTGWATVQYLLWVQITVLPGT